jgi:methylmalonyl-CoA/ethylmalonyl-CoA epimerase
MGTDFSIRRIGIAVRNLEHASEMYSLILGRAFRPVVGGRTEEVLCMECDRGPGLPTIELAQPVDDDGALARFIRKRGEGVHHLSVLVSDLDGTVDRISGAGGRIVHTTSHYRRSDGSPLREAFVHPKDAHGVLFHLVQEESGDFV